MRRSQSSKEGQAEQGCGEADTALYLHRPLALCAHATPLMMQVVAAILLVASTVEESVYGKKVDGGNTNEIIALSRERAVLTTVVGLCSATVVVLCDFRSCDLSAAIPERSPTPLHYPYPDTRTYDCEAEIIRSPTYPLVRGNVAL